MGGVEQFSTFAGSMAATFEFLLGEWDLDALKEQSESTWMAYPLFFIGMNVLMNWIILNVIIAIICDAFEASKEKYEKVPRPVLDVTFFIRGGHKYIKRIE